MIWKPRQHPNTSRPCVTCHPTKVAQSLPLLHYSHFLLTLLVSSIALAGLEGSLVTSQPHKLISAKQFEIVQNASKTPLLYQDLSVPRFGQVIMCAPSKAYIGCNFHTQPPRRTSLFVRQGYLDIWLSGSTGSYSQRWMPSHRNSYLNWPEVDVQYYH